MPSDAVLWHFPRHKAHMLTGYAKRRRDDLFRQLGALTLGAPGSGSEQDSPSTSSPGPTFTLGAKPGVIRPRSRTRRGSGRVEGLRAMVEPPDTALGLLDPELLERLKRGETNGVVPHAGELAFNGVSTDLVFKSDAAKRTVEVFNASQSETHWFWIQVSGHGPRG